MKKTAKIKESVNNYLYDHYWLKTSLYNGKGLIISLLSAFVFAFAFCAFVTPSSSAQTYFKIVTGGVSGLSQNIAKIVEMCGGKLSDLVVEAIGYSCLNLPLVIFAYFKIGKRFAVLSAINVLSSSLFLNFIPQWQLIKDIAAHPFIIDSPIVRAVFAGVLIGFSSAYAFKGELSCGGIDIINYYISLRKSSSVGKYGILTNACIVSLYSVLLFIQNPNNVANAFISLLFSIIYLVVANVVIDMINLRNKKVKLEFISAKEDLALILLSHFPHGATIETAKGAYSGQLKNVIIMVVSSSEVSAVVNLAKKADEHVFITITPLKQVYGNFFIKPIK